MAKILKIENDVVSIGNEDGSLSEIRISDCNFNPNVGDEVTLYSSEDKTLCVKVEAKNKTQEQVEEMIKGGININLTQNQNSGNVASEQCYPYATVSGKRAVNKTSYILFAFFLGGVGAHKFYAGKHGQGILYLIFVWTYIPSLIALIEAIVACCQKEDANGKILV